MPTRYTKADYLQQLQYEITNEISRDAKPIAQGVFGNNARHPDMASLSNQELDQLYRDAYQRGDRAFLQQEAQRDPQQFLDVTDRIGVPDPPVDMQGKPISTDLNAKDFVQSLQQPSPGQVQALPAPAVPPVPAPQPSPAAAPVAAPAGPAAPPTLLGPNGQPLPPSIPQMASGGIVTQPTLALIGEAGPEAVVPLSEQPRDRWALTAPGQPQVGQGRGSFVASLRPLATQAEQQTGIPANLYLAMAANETGWGRSQTAQQNNLFSVQGSGEGGRWASYDSPLESFIAFSDLLQSSPRYARAWAVRSDPAQFLNELRKAGYVADEPGYPAQAWVNQVSSIYRDLAAQQQSAATGAT